MALRSRYYAVFVTLLVILHFVLHLAFGFGREAPELLTVGALMADRKSVV